MNQLKLQLIGRIFIILGHYHGGTLMSSSERILTKSQHSNGL